MWVSAGWGRWCLLWREDFHLKQPFTTRAPTVTTTIIPMIEDATTRIRNTVGLIGESEDGDFVDEPE